MDAFLFITQRILRQNGLIVWYDGLDSN